jgi:two-component system response regulator HydG
MDQQIRVLVVDDDEPHAQAVAESLERVGYECVVATSGRDGLRLIEEQTFDIIVTDLIMDGVGGLEVLAKAKRELPEAEVVILTGHSTVKTAVTAMQAGATTYLTKPLDISELRTVADKVSQTQRLARSNIDLQRQLNERFGFEGVVGNSPAMHSVVARLRQIAPTSATVLITGESGTGKELVAKAIHNNSPKRYKPFVPLNCAALSENILESELFGHVRGAFTGADRERKGWFEYANGGTLFLDEVGDIPLSTQVKLLRALESGEIVRVGTNEPVKVNVRLISATNRDLNDAVAAGTFRQDLFHRLKVVSVKLPPLRQRREDIPLLIEYFLKEFTTSHGKTVSSITPATRKALMAHFWPGNVRELKNTIESMVVIDSDGVLDVDDLTEEIQASAATVGEGAAAGSSTLVGRSLEEIEKYYIAETLKMTGGNREEAARVLGIGERTLYRKLKEYGIGRTALAGRHTRTANLAETSGYFTSDFTPADALGHG